MKPHAFLCGILLSLLTLSHGQELEPNDGSLADNLVLWLRDAANLYDPDAGVWTDSSGKGHDASAVGDIEEVELATYVAGTLVTTSGGAFLDEEVSAVRFGADIDDLLVSQDINEDAGLDNLTIFAVYNVTMIGNDNLTRPVGIGSIAATQLNPGDHFNLASDPSVRKDNGQLGSGEYAQEFPTESLFIRSARMSPGAIDDWFNTDGTLTKGFNVTGASYTTSVDEFYLGDVRCGTTPVPGWGAATALSDFDIVQVVVYNRALSDQEVVGVNEWLMNNIEGIGEKSDPNAAVPRRFKFGQLSTVPQQITEIIQVKNSGESQALTITDVTILGEQKDHFTLNSVPDVIEAGGVGEISITFDQKGLTGGFFAEIEVKSDDPDPEDAVLIIALSAQVVDLSAPTNHYRLDESAGDVAVDASGNGLSGQYGAVVLGQDALASGTSASFSGGAQMVLPDSALDVLEDSFSISVWLQAASVAEDNQTLFSRGTDGPVFALLMNEDRLSWLSDSGEGLAPDVATESVIQAGTAHHIVAAYNDTAGERQLTLYVDGNLVGSVDDPGAVNAFDSASFFLSAFQGNLHFTGLMDDLQFYDRALNQEEVTRLRANPGEPLRTVGDPDSDADGLTDQEEVELGTDPLLADTDGDRLEDGDEKDTHLTDPTKADTDGDGSDDFYELKFGGDPLDPDVGLGTFLVRSVESNDLAFDSMEVFKEAIDTSASVGRDIITTSGFVNFSDGDNGRVIPGQLPFPLFGEPGAHDDYGIHVQGSILITEAGVRTFAVNSDDGNQLIINGEVVAEDPGLHASRDILGSIDLEAGEHSLELFYYERGGGAQVELFVNTKVGDVSEFNDGTFVLLPAFGVIDDDTDDDMLSDTWEREFFGDLSQEATGDPDADGLDNTGELGGGTDPNKADTDDDGLVDGVETGTGVYVDVTDSGTNATVADTDGDTLVDGVETNTGVFVSTSDTGTSPHLNDSDSDRLLDNVETGTGNFVDLNNTGSDPNKADTDGDGFSDRREAQEGSDPSDAASQPDAFDQLAPNDPTLATNLVAWLHSPDLNFDEATGVWMDASDKRNNAVPLVDLDFTAGVLSSGEQASLFTGPFATLKFSADATDMMIIESTNGGERLDALTIVAVYKVTTPGASVGGVRPVGFGSFLNGDLADNYNLATDPSIRKDNGNVGAGVYSMAHPEDAFLIRVSRLNESGVNEWFNDLGNLEHVLIDTGDPYVVATDRFYLGDLRTGEGDIEIAHVAVYNTDLTESQITGISSWLQQNVSDTPGGGGGDGSDDSFQIRSANANEAGTAITLTWTSTADTNYTVQTSVDLENWEDVQADVQSQGEETTFVSEEFEQGVRAQYYRIKEQ